MVFDEADLLLEGGFQQDTSRILQALQASDRSQKVDTTSRELGITPTAYASLPRHLKKAGYQGMLHHLQQPFPSAIHLPCLSSLFNVLGCD